MRLREMQPLERAHDDRVDDDCGLYLIGAPFQGLAKLFETSLLVGVDRHTPPIDYSR